MVSLGLHKSIVNRVLEPYLHIRVVASATDDGWMNFFGLRLDKAAQPEIRALAEAMWRARGESKPKLLQPGEWHTPFVEEKDLDMLSGFMSYDEPRILLSVEQMAIRTSVARCARVSYESFETQRRSNPIEDLKLHDRLLSARPIHASPAEHQATPDEPLLTFSEGREGYRAGINRWVGFAHHEQHGNFVGWRQYRKMLPGEAVAPLPKGYTA
jgi:thymidylate synthase ThyX